MKTLCRWLLALLPCVALASIGYGVWQIHPPSAFIVLGVLVLVDLYRKD